MSEMVKFVVLDVHKNTIAIVVAEDGKRAEVHEYGEIFNTPAALTKLLAKLGGPGVELHILLRGRAMRVRHSAPGGRRWS